MQSFKRFFFMLFHFHEWEVFEEYTIDRYDHETNCSRSIAIEYHQKCKVCGKIQSTRV